MQKKMLSTSFFVFLSITLFLVSSETSNEVQARIKRTFVISEMNDQLANVPVGLKNKKMPTFGMNFADDLIEGSGSTGSNYRSNYHPENYRSGTRSIGNFGIVLLLLDHFLFNLILF